MSNKREDIDLVRTSIASVEHLFSAHHGYKSVGKVATYCFAVMEDDRPVAAFTWNPPPPGAAQALSAAPGGGGVLALSRMVAVPKEERRLQKISKALRRQMVGGFIDRTRWPVLVTYSDASMGHTGHVYKCSGWLKDGERTVLTCTNEEGQRKSRYASGKRSSFESNGTAVLTRWVHRACPAGEEAVWMVNNGWWLKRIEGKTWSSGNPAYTWVRE